MRRTLARDMERVSSKSVLLGEPFDFGSSNSTQELAVRPRDPSLGLSPFGPSYATGCEAYVPSRSPARAFKHRHLLFRQRSVPRACCLKLSEPVACCGPGVTTTRARHGRHRGRKPCRFAESTPKVRRKYAAPTAFSEPANGVRAHGRHAGEERLVSARPAGASDTAE